MPEIPGKPPKPHETTWEPAELPEAGESQPVEPSMVGPYRLLELRGQGGMGSVWLAEQRKPVHRRVAIKIVKLGMDTKQVLARFEAERQALALMDHPNIAKVLDAGATDEGKPWFAMEFVPGDPLTIYCDNRKLTNRQRLELFVDVCHGVQHAHVKGVIHRDLKPQNVLVQLHDGRPIPKIIDFGVAKATNKSLTEQTLFTEQGQLIGTPEYMSPEQAEMSGVGIDARTDIYSLGVMLYELLTGTLPFDPTELRRAGILEIRRRIRDDEPPRPSTRVSTLGGGAEAQAKLRRTEPRALIKDLKGDLDWVTQKALAKDPTERYQSATEFAADIERHLRHETVSAGAPSVSYRLRKFLRRRRGPVAAGIAVLVALVGGLAAAVWQGSIAQENERIAKRNEKEATEALEKARLNERRAVIAEAKARTYADRGLVEELLEQATQDLLLAAPENVKPMLDWLARAREVTARLPHYRRRLEELRKRSEPLSAEAHAIQEELAELRDERGSLVDKLARARRESSRGARHASYQCQNQINRINTRIESQSRQFEKMWRFANQSDSSQHETLAGLLEPLERLERAIPGVEKRLDFARTVAQRTVDERRSDWRMVQRRVAQDERFPDGWKLEPQVGFLPLGPDPETKLEEFVHLQSGTEPERGDDGKLRLSDGTGVVFVLLPGGRFWMGSQSSDKGGVNYDPYSEPNDPRPREVDVEPFLLSKYELTQGQWIHLAGNNPSVHEIGERAGATLVTPLHPVENVSWPVCHQVLERFEWTLPTEKQWEYAARAGTHSVWWTGDEITSLQGAANVADACLKANGGRSWMSYDLELDDGYAIHAPVGTFRPNAFGLYNMIGNVREWCENRDDVHALSKRNVRLTDSVARRVYRGGAWRFVARAARSAFRDATRATSSTSYHGVRPAKLLPR